MVFDFLQKAMKEEPQNLQFTSMDGSWIVSPVTNSEPPAEKRHVRTFNLSKLPSSKVEDMFSLIGKAFEMHGGPLPLLKFHEETNTLLAHVDNDQEAVLKDLVLQISQAYDDVPCRCRFSARSMTLSL